MMVVRRGDRGQSQRAIPPAEETSEPAWRWEPEEVVMFEEELCECSRSVDWRSGGDRRIVARPGAE